MLKEHIYLSMNDVEKAADMVRLLIDQDPRSGKYYKALGDLYDNNKLSAKAAVVYENAEKKLPGDPYIQAGRAEHFLRVGDTAKYVSYMSKAIVSKDLEAESQMEWLGEFIQTLPSDSVIRMNAMPITRQLVQQHPEDAQIYSLYGSMLESNSQMDSAAWAYARSLQLKSSIETWRKLLDNFLVRQLGDSVVKYSERFIRSYPNQVEPQYYNAQGHYIKKEYDKAIKAINRAIDNQPENNKVALSSLYATMAEMYHSNKQEDFSEKAYDKALSLDADNAATLNNYAYNLSVLGKRLDDAERMSKRSLDLKPGFGAYLDTYGWILYKKGEFEKAKIFVKKSIDVSGNTADGTLYDHLGDIYYKLNAKDKALENWKIAKSLKVDNPLIDKKISEGKLYE
jgi:tetratricopeptide (TPR) repeat protein